MKYKVTTTGNMGGPVFGDRFKPTKEELVDTLEEAKKKAIKEGTDFFRNMVWLYGKNVLKCDVGWLLDGRFYCQIWVAFTWPGYAPELETFQKFIGIEGA